MKLQELLKKLMIKQNVSQYRLGKNSGVSQAQISRILQGQQPTVPTLEKIASGLGVSVSELIGEKPQRKTG
ncbi:MAG: Cro/C1-type DNA-binding domain [Firmicutes bacterium]|nr:Cro/C1-type DNA-binding domain [Bacillota bacterium]